MMKNVTNKKFFNGFLLKINVFIIFIISLLIFPQFINIVEIGAIDGTKNLDTSKAIQINNPFAVCHGHGNSIDEAYNMTVLGIQMTRNDIYWEGIQQKADVFDYSRYDTFYNNINAVGIEPLAILDYGNRFLFPKTDGRIITGEQIDLWKTFVNKTVNRYMDKIKYWEIWNEPNLNGFWSGTDEEFFTLLNVTMRLIKDINPDLKILSPGISGHNPDYLNAMISFIGDDEFDKYIDVLAFHPYSGSSNEDVRQKSKEVWNVVRAHNFSGEVWITEVGRSTQISDVDKKYERQGEFNIQARELIKAFSCALSENISRIVWYCYSDWWNINWTYGEANFGIIYRENETGTYWKYKPAAVLYQKMSQRLTNSTYYPEAIKINGFNFGTSYNDYSFYFKTSDNKTILIIWTQNMPYLAKISLQGAKNVIKHELFENSSKTLDSNELNNIKISDIPIFLEIEWIDEPINIYITTNPTFGQLFSFLIGPILALLGVCYFIIKEKMK